VQVAQAIFGAVPPLEVTGAVAVTAVTLPLLPLTFVSAGQPVRFTICEDPESVTPVIVHVCGPVPIGGGTPGLIVAVKV
jgi:hypothetical protein